MTASRPPRELYRTLGLKPDASDEELRSAYRRLVRIHHPDHNGGSRESTVRFQEIQDAYNQIQALRRRSPGGARAAPRPPSDPGIDSRLADIERELREAQAARERARREAHAARERARRAAREAAASTGGSGRPERASDEELGYVTTDDSFTKIAADVWDELSERFSQARRHPAVKRVEDLLDELQGHGPHRG